MGFTPLAPISTSQISRIREVLGPIYRIYKSPVSEYNQCGTQFQIKENTTKFKIN